MLSKCGSLKTAGQLFEGLLERNVFMGFDYGRGMCRMRILNNQLKHNVGQKVVTQIIGVLLVCVGDLDRGRLIHKLLLGLEIEMPMFIFHFSRT